MIKKKPQMNIRDEKTINAQNKPELQTRIMTLLREISKNT